MNARSTNEVPARRTRWVPRHLSMVAAVAAVALALAFALWQETPVGRVSGRVVLAESGKPLSKVRIVLVREDDAENSEEIGERKADLRRAVTDAQGRFSIEHVPSGFYRASASTHAHTVKDQSLSVDEAQTAQVTLKLKRSLPALDMVQQQRVFVPSERAYVPVRGYVDGKKPAGRDTLRVRVFGARLSTLLGDAKSAEALTRVGQRYEPLPRLPQELLHPASAAAPRLISSREVPIKEGDREGFFHQRLDLGVKAPGVYLVDLEHAGKSGCAWVQITDTGLVIKKARGQLVAFTVDMQSGRPRAGSAIKVYRGGQVVARGRSDARGLADLQVPPAGGANDPEGDNRLMVVATSGQNEDAVRRDDYEYEEQGLFTLHAYTDRPIYRPGQRIDYKGIVRRNLDEGRAASSARYAVPNGEPVTVEVRDPNGERLLRQGHAANSFGSFHGEFELSPEAPTGVYTLVSTVRGEKHTQDIVVASYQKPEFTVSVTPAQKRYALGERVEMIVSAQFYFGAPVAGARVKYSISRDFDWAAEYPDDYGYDEWDQEGEGDRYREVYEGDGGYGESVSEGQATLDETGKASIEFAAAAPDKGQAPQAQIFRAHVTVIDAAKREVESDGEVQVTSGNFRLAVSPEGYVAKPGAPTPVTISARDYDGHAVANVPVELNWGYWQAEKDADANPGGSSSAEFKTIALRRIVTDKDGKASVNVRPPRAGELRLEAHAVDAAGHEIRGRATLWSATDAGGDFQTQYPDLSLLTDKRRYRPGETARVLINADHIGQTALVSVEGTRVYRTLAVPIARRSTVVEVPILAGYGPNVFLAACYVRDKKWAQSQIPLRVDVPQRQVKVQVQPDRFKHAPGERVSFQIKTTASDGRPVPCELSFGVVDEAIYALREDDPLALRDTFYPRRYNAVNTSFSFAAEYLGDADKAAPQIVTRKKFPDTAYWNPTLRTDEQGRAEVSFVLPDNLTTWRATAIAQTLDTALGRQTRQNLVTKDFFVRLEKPRFLTQKDESRLLAFVHNGTTERQTALVRLVASGLNIGGEATQTITVEPNGEGQVTWPVSAAQMGEAKLTVTAWTPQNGGKQWTDGIEAILPVRPHGREVAAGWTGELLDGAPRVETINLEPSAAPGATRLTVRLTPSVLGSFWDALEYLVGFPYGCTEQTLSRFLPDIQVQRLLRSNGASLGGSEGLQRLQTSLPRMVRDGLARLYRLQHESGGWGWWENDDDDAWMTAYVLYGLAVARDEGYAVSDNVLGRGRQAGLALLPKAKGKNKAFLLYALALCGERETVKAARAKFDFKALGAQALSYVVLLDKTLGLDTGPAWNKLLEQARTDGNMLHWTVGAFDADSLWDERTATAAGLRAMLSVNPNDPRIGSVLRWLMLHRSGENWGDTLATSMVLTALCDYLQKQPGAASTGGQVSVRLNGKLLKTETLTPDVLREPDIVLRVPPALLRAGRNEVTLERSGGKSLIFYSLQLRQTLVTEDLAALSPGKLSVQREFLRVLPRQEGAGGWKLSTEATGNQLNQGDRVRVRLTLNVPRALSYVLIEDAFPSGCEVTERGNAEESQDDWKFWWSSVDVRDDRIAFFARSIPPGKHVIEYNLRAQTPGTFHVLPALLQEMYNPATRAESDEARLEIGEER